MKRLKNMLSLLLALALVGALIPVALGAEVVEYRITDGSSPETVFIIISMDQAPQSGMTVTCTIDVPNLLVPANYFNAGIKSVKITDGITRKFIFELNRPTYGPAESWNAYLNFNGVWEWLGEVDAYYPWEPSIQDAKDEPIVSVPTVTQAGPTAPLQMPDVAVATLDITNETLILAEDSRGDPLFSVAGFSLDGGVRWKKGIPTQKNIATLFKKGGTLVLTDQLTAKGKKIPFPGKAAVAPSEANPYGSSAEPSAALLTFTKLNPAPKTPRLKVVYNLQADETGATTGCWTFVDRNNTEIEAAVVRDNLRISWAPNGKTPVVIHQEYIDQEIGDTDFVIDETTGFVYGKFGENTGTLSLGVSVAPTLGKKVGKQTYLIRLVAQKNSDGSVTPASRPLKVRVSDQVKAPKLRPDYRRESMKLKAGMTVVFGEKVANPEAVAERTTGGFAAAQGKCLVNLSREDAKLSAMLQDFLIETETTITAWRTATARKPAGVKQMIQLAPRAVLTAASLVLVKGRVSASQMLEFYDIHMNRYTKFPKVTGSYTSKARVKATAKPSKDYSTYTGLAASRDGVMNVVSTVDAKGKRSIANADIAVPIGYAPYLVNIGDLTDQLIAEGQYTVRFPITVGTQSGTPEFTLEVSDGSVTAGTPQIKGDFVEVSLDHLSDQTAVVVKVTAVVTDETAQIYATACKLSAQVNLVVDTALANALPEEPGDESGDEPDEVLP